MAKGYKTGGRKKGTPNKTTSFAKEVFNDVLHGYFDTDLLKKDLKAVDADKRLDFMIKIASFVVPKPQTIDMNMNATLKQTSIDDVLAKLAKENDEA